MKWLCCVFQWGRSLSLWRDCLMFSCCGGGCAQWSCSGLNCSWEKKKEKCSFWTTCSVNNLSCGNRVICISPAAAGGSAYESRHDWSSWEFQGWAKCKNWLPFNSWAGIKIELAMSQRMLNLNLNRKTVYICLPVILSWRISVVKHIL